jgi:hypothetical protein
VGRDKGERERREKEGEGGKEDIRDSMKGREEGRRKGLFFFLLMGSRKNFNLFMWLTSNGQILDIFAKMRIVFVS